MTILPTDLGDAPDQVIPLPNVTANVLKKVRQIFRPSIARSGAYRIIFLNCHHAGP
jgi:hypothetical protein